MPSLHKVRGSRVHHRVGISPPVKRLVGGDRKTESTPRIHLFIYNYIYIIYSKYIYIYVYVYVYVYIYNSGLGIII